MDLNHAALIATACAAGCLGLVAYFRAPDHPANRIFATHCLSMALWAFLTYLVMTSTAPGQVTLLLRVMHFVAPFVVATLIDFVWVFPERLTFERPRRRYLLYLSCAVFAAIAGTPALVRYVEVTPATPLVRFGWPLAVLAVWAFPMLVYVNYLLWHKARTLGGLARVQIIYVLAGTLACEAVVIWADVVMPMYTGTTTYSRWGVASYLLTAAAITLAIAKYRLWDLGSLARRMAAVALAVGTIAPFAGFVLSLAVQQARAMQTDPGGLALVSLMIGAAAGLMIKPMADAYRGIFSRALQEERERIAHFLSALGEAVVHARTGAPTLQPMLDATQGFFGTNLVEAYLRSPEGLYHNAGGVYAEGAEGRPGSQPLHLQLPVRVAEALKVDQIADAVEAGQLVRFGSMADAVAKLGAMDALGASVIVPLRWQDENIGLLVLGPKLSRDMYTSLDVDLLKSVAAHAALGVKNAELRAQIIAEKERTEKVLARMESGVVVADRSKTIRLVNPAACALLGKTEEELLNQWTGVLPEVLRTQLHMAIDAGTTSSGARVPLNHANDLWIACHTFVLEDPQGKREGAGIVFRDLRTEEALRRAEREAERLKFVRAVAAGMAHEIRNPLVAIRTFAELAPQRLDDPEFRQSFVEVARSEVMRLEELVQQFLTLAKPTSIVRERVDLGALVGDAVTSLSAGAQAKGLAVQVEGIGEPLVIKGDESRLRQAMMNLLLNALDAAPPGGQVEVRVGIESAMPGEAGEALVTIWNSGSYIPPEQRERVFEPFYTSKTEGTGLGLAICHTIVDEHGGRITVESDREHGTSFTLRLPLPAAAPTTANTSP
jgi:signal transduction histidine kinase